MQTHTLSEDQRKALRNYLFFSAVIFFFSAIGILGDLYIDARSSSELPTWVSLLALIGYVWMAYDGMILYRKLRRGK